MSWIQGRTVLVTGAARGIGASVARSLAGRGANVALVGLEPELLAKVADGIGPRAAWWEADVTDASALARAAASAAERFGGIDVVVANAGITNFGPLATIETAAFERVIEVNLLGVWRTLRATMPFVRARRGYLLVISSLSASINSPLQGHYTASKAGVAAMANSLRVELRGSGTDVGVAYMTFVRTDLMLRDTLRDPAGALVWGGNRGVWGMVSPERATRGLVRAIERRARDVVVPGFMRPVMLAPGVFQPIMERFFRRDQVERAIRAAEDRQASTRGPAEDRQPSAIRAAREQAREGREES